MRNSFLILLLIFISIFSTAKGELKTKGESVKLIGGNGTIFMHPLWSPDGSQVAFTETRYRGIWVMNADGSGVKQITDEPAAGFGFEWSSDSKTIVSRVAKYEGRYRYNVIKLFDLETNKSRLLSDYRTFMPGLPHWADADEKVYMFNRGKLEIFDSDKKSNSLQKPLASKQICFLKDDHIAIGNITTKNYRVLEPIKGQQYINLVVSPDGSKVAFEVLGGNLFVMNMEGTGLVDLARGHRPQWAPDNQHLVFMMTIDDGYSYLYSDIYAIKIDGTDRVRLTPTDDKLEMNPSWSPDGKKIAFDVMDEGAIYVIEVAK